MAKAVIIQQTFGLNSEGLPKGYELQCVTVFPASKPTSDEIKKALESSGFKNVKSTMSDPNKWKIIRVLG